MVVPAAAPPPGSEASSPGGLLETLRRFREEAIRGQRILKRVRWIAILPCLAAAGALYLRDPGSDSWTLPVAFLVLGSWGLSSLIFRGWRARFKREVIGLLASEVGSGLRYEPEGTIPRDAFEGSGLFKLPVTVYRGEDLVAGRAGGGEVRCCDVEASRLPKSVFSVVFPRLAIRLASRKDLERIFKGLFVQADFSKSFRATTLLLPEPSSAHAASLQGLRRKGASPLEPVRLEDPEFERLFKVYSSDQVEARYLLSPSLMQRLAEARGKWRRPFAASFHSSCLYLAFPGSRDRLEPPAPSRFLRDCGEEISAGRSPWELGDYLEELRFGIQLADELNLNTRIWSRA